MFRKNVRGKGKNKMNDDWLGKATELEAQNDLLRTQIEMLSVTNYDRVKQFHDTFLPGTDPENPTKRSRSTDFLRLNLILEEAKEVSHELGYEVNYTIVSQMHHEVDLVRLSKELSDLLYVTYGTGLAYGLPLDDVFAEVHRSNMSKLGPDGRPIYRDDGKVLKGPDYTPPQLDDIVFGEWNEDR